MAEFDDTNLHEFECETCGKKETLTDEQAYQQGWDYPPFIGQWGVVSPRTCSACLIDTTAYWAIVTTKGPVDISALDERHQRTLKRIAMEPHRDIIDRVAAEHEEKRA